MRPAIRSRLAATAALIATLLVAPAPAGFASDQIDYCDPAYPAVQVFDELPTGAARVSGTITGGDAGPWQVAVEAGGQRTPIQQTGDGGSFEFWVPADVTPFLVIDGSWRGRVTANTPTSIVLPPMTDLTVTTLDWSGLGPPVPAEGIRVYLIFVGVFGVWGAATPFQYIGSVDGAGTIQGISNSSGQAVLTGIPNPPDQPDGGLILGMVACFDGVPDSEYVLFDTTNPSYSMPGDADGVPGVLEDLADGDRDDQYDSDGNQDGTPDKEQSHVATLPAFDGAGNNLTVDTSPGTILGGISSTTPAVAPPPGYELPVGVVTFALRGIVAGSTHPITYRLFPSEGVLGHLTRRSTGPPWAEITPDRVVRDPANYAITVSLTDGGVGDLDGSPNGVIQAAGGPFTITDTAPADGVADVLQPGGTAPRAFDDGSTPATTGQLVNANGLTTRVTDDPDPAEGVLVTVDPRIDGTGSGPAVFEACGSTVLVTVLVEPGSQVQVKCGSVIVAPVLGSATVVLDNGDTITVPAGASAEIEDTASGVTLTNVTGGTVTATIGGVSVPVPDGDGPYDLVPQQSWVITGFAAPVDSIPTVNSGKAGRAIPLKWHLADSTGAPVTDLASASITVGSLACSAGLPVDPLEETLTLGGTLQNLGNGDYQLNWKTNKAWAGTCKELTLDVGRGASLEAHFSFKR